MKQCPVCKTTYTDVTLKFCLADGNLLTAISETEAPTVFASGRNPLQINIAPDTVTTSDFSPDNAAAAAAVAASEPRQKSGAPYLVAALVGILLLAAIGVGAVFLLNSFGKTETANANNAASNSASNAATAASNKTAANGAAAVNDDLQKKIAELEKRIKEQANQKNASNQTTGAPVVAPPPPSLNNPDQPTARVAKTSDGFLSLRTEPSVKTGTQLVKIPSGAIVQLENCQKNPVTIDGRSGRWCLVTYNGETGWAFDAWLVY